MYFFRNRPNLAQNGFIASCRKSETEAWHYSISNARCLVDDAETKIQNLSNRRRAFLILHRAECVWNLSISSDSMWQHVPCDRLYRLRSFIQPRLTSRRITVIRRKHNPITAIVLKFRIYCTYADHVIRSSDRLKIFHKANNYSSITDHNVWQ